MLNDLTVGKPMPVIWRFSIPLLLSTALQQLYNITGSIIVGQFAGKDGLASIGAAYPITLFYIAVATGSSMGASVVISQLFGAKKLKEMKSAIFTAIISLSVLGVILAIAGASLSRTIMALLNARASIFEASSVYLALYSIGVIPMFVFNTATGIFTALGDSKRPLYFLLMSSVLNIVLILFSVGVLDMGVTGAALSTVISQLVAAALCMSILVKHIKAIKVDEKAVIFDRKLFRDMSKIAIPSIFQQSCVALAHTIVQSLVNTFDTSVIAGYEAASKIHNFAYMSFNTLGIALSSFVAQCFGARKLVRIREGFRASTTICFALTVFVVLIMQIMPDKLIGLFVNKNAEPDVIKTGVNFLRIISPDYLIICFIITIGGLLRGIGRVRDFFFVTVVDFTVRVVMSFVLTKALNSYTCLFWSWYFGSVIDVVICFMIFANVVKKGELRLSGSPIS